LLKQKEKCILTDTLLEILKVSPGRICQTSSDFMTRNYIFHFRQYVSLTANLAKTL